MDLNKLEYTLTLQAARLSSKPLFYKRVALILSGLAVLIQARRIDLIGKLSRFTETLVDRSKDGR